MEGRFVRGQSEMLFDVARRTAEEGIKKVKLETRTAKSLTAGVPTKSTTSADSIKEELRAVTRLCN